MLASWLISILLTAPSPVLSPLIPIAHAEENKQTLWIEKLIACESMGSTTIRVLDTNGKYSYGLFQFQLSTWLSYGKEFGATKENIYNGELQRRVAKSMLDAGGWRHWYHCSRRVSSSLYPYPQISFVGSQNK